MHFRLQTNSMNKRKTAKSDTEAPVPVSVPGRGEDFQITPFMALAVALIYMLTADGAIDEHESSQLQAVVGSHKELLDIAFAYAEENSVEQFLKDTQSILVQADHGCILTNLCDCLLSDGSADDHELQLFHQISDAFGVSQMSFKTHFTNLSLKNNKSLLGNFSQKSLTLSDESAHLTLACCLVYMMAADGNIADEEIGQLQVVLGEFDGLQAAAMTTVRSVKMNEFLRQAAPLLTQDQKIMILSNVCDSMMSDGKIDVIEDNLFQNMRTAFSVPTAAFKSYYETIKIKCIKPFDTESIPTAFHSRVTAKKKNNDTGTFKIRRQKSADAIESTGSSSAPNSEGEWVSEVDQKQLSAVVNRTMQDNIKQANDSFSGQSDVENIQSNAVNMPAAGFSKSSQKNENLQKAQEGAVKDNIQQVDANGVNSNQQKLAGAAVAANIQQVDDDAIKSNPQKLAGDAVAANIQQVGDDAIKTNAQKLAGIAAPVNTQLLAPASDSANPQAIPATVVTANIQSLPSEALTQQKGNAADRAGMLSQADLPKEKLPNRQQLGSTIAQASALKLVDPQALEDLQSQIDKVHSNLDKLAPATLPKAPPFAFASLVLETRLPPNHQLRQKPSVSLPEASQAIAPPAFEKNLQSLADEQLRSSDSAPPKATDPGNTAKVPSEKIANDTTMLSNLTQAIHSDDVWAMKDNGLNQHVIETPLQALNSLPPQTLNSVPPQALNLVQTQALNSMQSQTLVEIPSIPFVPGVPFFKKILPVANEVTNPDPVSAAEPVLVDGSVDWRILWLLIVLFSMPAVMFGRSLLYPAQICQGTGQLERKWMEQGSGKPAVLINEESASLSHRIQFSPSHVLLDGQRFPLYKELNQSSHFAEATSAGIKGAFNTHGIAKTRYTFVYDQAIQELRIDMQSSGLGTLEGRVGWVEENTSFTGRCANDWF
jgi:uncharacterized tellurite resistance protein B-like protein